MYLINGLLLRSDEDILKVPMGTVATKISRAKKKLKEELQANELQT